MLNLEILTPTRTILSEEVDEVSLPTETGQIGILPQHATLVTGIEAGLLQFRTNETWRKIFSFSGVAEVDNNNVQVMILDAENIEDINLDYAKKKLDESLEILNQAKTDRQKKDAEKGVNVARKRLYSLSLLDA
uniref:ATP synthase CF1 subunit epsilon n=1 Tax=Olisthodiscus luteus TaxID=83000 RepID=A0A7U0KT37_OLILU|nr:ATP synthase CF1 subunit epsilon [Olisthodiscus luteus]QQW50549.1 ATP synthase CF1 subunit epsilon [Olisthodiscus luteus]